LAYGRDLEAQSLRGGAKATVVGRECHELPLGLQKMQGGQVQRVERSHSRRERLQGASEHRCSQFEEGDWTYSLRRFFSALMPTALMTTK
jgi:hypothetical protein